MVRAVSATFQEQKTKAENQPIFLYTIEKYDDQNDLHLAACDTDITFGGIVYSSFPIRHEYISENNQGQLERVKVLLANVSRFIQVYLEQYDFRGKKVIIRMVWADKLADADAHIDDIFYIDSYTANQQNAEFTLSGKFDVLDLYLPARRYSRNYCAWRFRSPECGYTGGEAVCGKTRQRCKQLGNYKRYGAFPSVPSKRMYVM